MKEDNKDLNTENKDFFEFGNKNQAESEKKIDETVTVVSDSETEVCEIEVSDSEAENKIAMTVESSDRKSQPSSDIKKKKHPVVSACLWVVIVALFICCAFMIYGNIIYNDLYLVDGASMTIQCIEGEGDNVTVVNYGYVDGSVVYVSQSEVKRGDVVILQKGDSKSLIKRIVAFGGDSIWVEDGYVCVKTTGGESYTITEAEGAMLSRISDFELGNLAGKTANNPYIVPNGCLYYMGDNRNNSTDSRAKGAVPLTDIRGKVEGFVPDWYFLIVKIRDNAIK